MIKLSTSRWVDYPGLFVGPQYNHECYHKREAEGNSREEKGMWEEMEIWRCCNAGFEDGGRSHEPQNTRNAALEAGKGKETLSALELLEGAQFCWHLDEPSDMGFGYPASKTLWG